MLVVRFAVIYTPGLSGFRGFLKRFSIAKQINSLLRDFEIKLTNIKAGKNGGYYEISISGSDSRFLDDVKYEISRIDGIQYVECIPMTYQIGLTQETYLYERRST